MGPKSIFLILFSGMWLAAAPCWPAASVTSRATFSSVTGKVTVQRPHSKRKRTVHEGSTAREGDRVAVGKNSSATLVMFDGSQLEIGSESSFILSKIQKPSLLDKILKFKLLVGKVLARVKKLGTSHSAFEISAGGVVCGVRGTVYQMIYDTEAKTVDLSVSEGTVFAQVNGGPVTDYNAGKNVKLQNVLGSNTGNGAGWGTGSAATSVASVGASNVGTILAGVAMSNAGNANGAANNATTAVAAPNSSPKPKIATNGQAPNGPTASSGNNGALTLTVAGGNPGNPAVVFSASSPATLNGVIPSGSPGNPAVVFSASNPATLTGVIPSGSPGNPAVVFSASNPATLTGVIPGGNPGNPAVVFSASSPATLTGVIPGGNPGNNPLTLSLTSPATLTLVVPGNNPGSNTFSLDLTNSPVVISGAGDNTLTVSPFSTLANPALVSLDNAFMQAILVNGQNTLNMANQYQVIILRVGPGEAVP